MPPNTVLGARRIHNKPVRRIFINVSIEKSDVVIERRYPRDCEIFIID